MPPGVWDEVVDRVAERSTAWDIVMRVMFRGSSGALFQSPRGRMANSIRSGISRLLVTRIGVEFTLAVISWMQPSVTNRIESGSGATSLQRRV